MLRLRRAHSHSSSTLGRRRFTRLPHELFHLVHRPSFSFRIVRDPTWSEYVVMSDCDCSECRFSPIRSVCSTLQRGAGSYFPHNANAVQRPSQADKPPIRWPGGRAASGGSELRGGTPAAHRFLRFIVSRGSRRAAV